MSEWEKIILGSYIETNKKNIGEGYPFSDILYLDTGSITANRIEKLQEYSIPNIPSRAKRLVEDKDIIYSLVRPNQLHYGFIKNPKENLVVSTGFVVISCNKKKIQPEYLFYYLSSYNITEYLHSIAEASTSTYPSLKPSDVEALKVFLPPLPEQRAIASVLSCLNDKIDLLHRQNLTLEQMAETLFRQWFIEDAKEDWEYTELKKYVKIYNGVSYKSEDLKASNKALVTLKNFSRDGSLRLDGFKEYTGRYKKQHVVIKNDLVVAHTDITQNADIIGNPLMIIDIPKYSELIISMDMVKVETKFEWLSKEFLYYLMRTRLFKEHCVGYSNGSTVLHLNKEAIPSFEFFLPPKKRITDFTKKVAKIISKKNNNINQIRTLEKMRDTLLPKLMSGEVKVRDII